MGEEGSNRGRSAVVAAIGLIGLLAGVGYSIAHADGPVFIFQGGPFTSGEIVAYESFDWTAVDDRTELQMEIVGAATSLTLWFSVTDGVAYVACDLDCEDGRLDRWPAQVRADDRVVLRVDGRRIEGRLTYVPHETPEYARATADRKRKYSGDGGFLAAAETAAHATVVEVGENLTGRSGRAEPGDRVFRFDPR